MTASRLTLIACLGLLACFGSAVGQPSYVPGTKLLILRANPPLPERGAVEHVLAAFARSHGFDASSPMGHSSSVYGKDPDLSLVSTFAPRYINVVLWTDPEERASYGKEMSDLLAALQPLGFRRVDELPVEPD